MAIENEAEWGLSRTVLDLTWVPTLGGKEGATCHPGQIAIGARGPLIGLEAVSDLPKVEEANLSGRPGEARWRAFALPKECRR